MTRPPRSDLFERLLGATGFEPTRKAEASKIPRLPRPGASPSRGIVPLARKAVPVSPTDRGGQGLHA
jgi:hypothetical protein